MSLHRGNVDPDQIQHPDDTTKFLRADATWATVPGATASTFWNIVNFTTPPSSWTQVNFGGATEVVNADGSVYLKAPNNAGTSLRCLAQTAPGTPYTITALMILLFNTGASAAIGLFFRDSTGGKLLSLHVVQTGVWNVDRWNSVTSFNSVVFSTASFIGMGSPVWMRINDDGTNLNLSISPDGLNWTQIYTELRHAFLAAGPDQIGFFVDQENNTASNFSATTLLSWKQT